CARVKQKRCDADCRICISGVEVQRSSADSGVEVGSRSAKQRVSTECSIANAARKTVKSVLAFRGGEVGIASVRRRHDCLRSGQKLEAGQRDEKYWYLF